MPDIRPKTQLYRNYDQAFEKQLDKPTAERKIGVNACFMDNPFGFTLEMTDETGARVLIAEPFEKEPARKEQAENIRTQLAKLGNTPFEANSVTVDMADNWFVPSSLLATMRRQATERLIANRLTRYPREIVQRMPLPKGVVYPATQLTYLGNVSNKKAQQFYHSFGVKTIAPAFEVQPEKDVPLMFSRHCLRYSMGWCPTLQKGKSPYKEPYYLLYKDTRLRLKFDCKQCQMLVYAD